MAVENVEVKEYDEDEESEIEESDKNEEQVERRGETKICECDENHKKGSYRPAEKAVMQKRRPPAQADQGERPGAGVHPVAGRRHDPPRAETAQCSFYSGCRGAPTSRNLPPPRRGDARTRLAGKENEPAAEVTGGRPKIQSQAPQVYIPIHLYVGTEK